MDSSLEHVPNLDTEDRGALRFVYAVAKLKGGGVQFDCMGLSEVKKIQAQSKAGQSGPWVSHFEEMAKKTVIRRLFKYLPVSIEMSRAVGLDEEAERGEQGNAVTFDLATTDITQTSKELDEAFEHARRDSGAVEPDVVDTQTGELFTADEAEAIRQREIEESRS